jgi:ATP-binding cassette, subfamily C (CFTR/MRP), member 1
MIYCKTLNLSANALDESSECSHAPGYCSLSTHCLKVAVTLMSTDSENICLTFANLHEVWASPIECGVALYLLYRNLGLAALTPMTVTMSQFSPITLRGLSGKHGTNLTIAATISIMQLARFMGNAQRTWIRGTQTRVDVTASMLGSMKVRISLLRSSIEC